MMIRPAPSTAKMKTATTIRPARSSIVIAKTRTRETMPSAILDCEDEEGDKDNATLDCEDEDKDDGAAVVLDCHDDDEQEQE